MSTLRERLREALAGSVLLERLDATAAPLLEKHGEDRRAWRDPRVLAGLARAVSTRSEVSQFLAHRSSLYERLVQLDAEYTHRRSRELTVETLDPGDLEGFLDTLRLRRREETVLVACLDLGRAIAFEEASRFLSVLAEATVDQALAAARSSAAEYPVCVIGMGKIGGREFTYYSDLDLVFLYEGGPDAVVPVSRLAQRLISYLSTMTGAGVAYSVDTRLRPSGQQGTLVTSFEAFERYQCEKAEPWEHLALVRARPISGDAARGRATLDAVRRVVLPRARNPWPFVADMRTRVERERARERGGRRDLKTGPGGLMDVEFLAQAAVLERGEATRLPELPSVPELLRGAVRAGSRERLLADYAWLRRVEARARWLAGRPVDAVDASDAGFPLLAELVDPGSDREGLLARLDATRGRIREDFTRVVRAGSLRALEEANG